MAPRPWMVALLSLFTLVAVLRAGHGGVADVTLHMKILSPDTERLRDLPSIIMGQGPDRSSGFHADCHISS